MHAHDSADMDVFPVGVVRSSILTKEDAPKMEHEGGVEAVIEILPEFREGMLGLEAGQQVVLLTWLHLSRRDLLQVHPRGDRTRPLQGVFNTRSPNRPNPIGLHVTNIVRVAPDGIAVHPLEVLDGTPIIDIKPLRGTPSPVPVETQAEA
ncbi:tRNA (N6-threonylcarbamoyladenosine(37)-N6)-methyltransferase TrmO [Megalodesulfovibrio gigas]|uniref:Putative methyltransferase, YaeB family n=1 Tax=Megalodesulfovibrio gigas (strain ATCC 19364 / DSM 1382 / NCIMB 9332 / VKM B-1759) TaxID=1121448 RepID=T2G9L7_MEGG1|nr:tRNA (N6-threonylcarbamoyladenosine(37)-N6)-methyltransferase TrmO [Megalodesulfovibrio gigas]AGW13290.1 putative methyltransferase, YaeB family [Megalodesulfovibrio gigas DSM 1382 = ATCC 19364]